MIIQELFSLFNDQYFYGTLGCVTVEWSNRMTLCAGVCAFKGGNDVVIRLSEKLLKYRPESDLVNTLLHEMIHAFLFLTARISHGHGPDFIFHMNRINALAATQITIFHNFHAEVAYYKVHEWKCNGSCRLLPPFYGIVKRAMNRAPSAADWWWAKHQATCGGTFHKVNSPSEKPATQKKSNLKIQKFLQSKDSGAVGMQNAVGNNLLIAKPPSLSAPKPSSSSSMNPAPLPTFVDLTVD